MSQTLTARGRLAVTIEAATAQARTSELTAVWQALWRSRLLVWVVGAVASIVLGDASGAVRAFDPTHVSISFGQFGNVLASPAVRWDSIWYLKLAHGGYQTAQQASFYPLYPMLIRGFSVLTGSPALAGVLLSLVAMFVGLVFVYRLTELELGTRFARATVDLIAFGPMALFLSAVYTESLFLALSAGTLYAARRGRWATAGALGGLAALTRVTGVLLVVPVLLMFFYGPRDDVAAASSSSRWRPKYRCSRQILWAALIPGGLGLFSLYLTARGFGPEAMVHGQQHFYSHQLVGPFAGIWDGAVAAWREIRLELAGVPPATYSSQALLQFGGLILAGVALVGVCRRLPLAYGAYAALGLLVPLASPTAGDPLRGLDRYASVLFPLFMWAAAWGTQHRAMRPMLIASGVLLAFFTAQFATWHWVGTPLL